jgi:hypothetical protein
MTGLVIDGGATFVQRREQQNVADSAAMAGAYAYLMGGGDSGAAISAAQSVAATNGYPNGTDGTAVTVSVTPGTPTLVTVSVSKPHRNYFSGIVGMGSWGVSTTATAETQGGPNGAFGAMPIIFNKKAMGNGTGSDTSRSYDEPGNGNQDVPQTNGQFNWTVFCTANGNPCNANTRTVDDLINGQGTSTVVTLNEDIGPLNAGSHTALFSDLSSAVNSEFPVAIVNDAGDMLGWAIFHLTGSVGGSTKEISGYFVSPVNSSDLRVIQNGGQSTYDTGTYVVNLVN